MKVFRLLLSVILAMAGGFHMTWAGEIHGTSAGRNWNCFSCCTRTGQLVDSTAGRARAWKLWLATRYAELSGFQLHMDRVTALFNSP